MMNEIYKPFESLTACLEIYLAIFFSLLFLSAFFCADDNSEISDKFAVLHINDCGDEVGKVSEVTTTHVKLTEPEFSLIGVLIKVGIPLKINCYVLIYKTNTVFLTLHVYLIPRDRGKQQVVEYLTVTSINHNKIQNGTN